MFDSTPICYVGGLFFIYVIRIHLHILVSTTIAMSDDVRII